MLLLSGQIPVFCAKYYLAVRWDINF